MNDSSIFGTPQEQPVTALTKTRRLSIGLPACSNLSERRFPMTPEGVKKLVEQGYRVVLEHGAANVIHYADNAYLRCGAEVSSRQEALGCDIVVHLAPLEVPDLCRMRRGAMLLTLLHPESLTAEIVRGMQKMAIVGVAVDLVTDERGHRPFADILAEIDGRTAIAAASSLLADSQHGKGILLGGVAGINPCEVTVIGSGIAAIAAARSATGLGAIVRMFDDDVYSLRSAVRDLGPQIIGSVVHERVLANALRGADVVIVTSSGSHVRVDADEVDAMKRGVITMDLTPSPGKVFPSMPLEDLAGAYSRQNRGEGKRVCYINAGSAVPRTAAMAMSNTFNTLFGEILTCEGYNNALKLTTGLRKGVFTFLGKVTNPTVAKIAGCRSNDINIFLQLS